MYLLQEIFLNMYVFKIRINPQDGSPLSHRNLSYIVLATYGEIFIVALHVLKLKPYKVYTGLLKGINISTSFE